MKQEVYINEDFTRQKDQMEFPLRGGAGVLIRDGEQFIVGGKKVVVYPGSVLMDIITDEVTIFVIKDKIHYRRQKNKKADL